MYNLYTPVKTRKKKIAGRYVLIPGISSEKRSVGVAAKWLIKVAKKNKKKKQNKLF